jgi:hypothetical protein
MVNYFKIVMSKSRFPTTFGPVKKVVAIAFIFLLSAECVFKLTIITYFEANRDYIAEVLCVNKEKPITMCNGQCFLDRNLSIADDEASKDASPTNNRLQVESAVFVTHFTQIDFAPTSSETDRTSVPQSLYDFSVQHSFFHPPC